MSSRFWKGEAVAGASSGRAATRSVLKNMMKTVEGSGCSLKDTTPRVI